MSLIALIIVLVVVGVVLNFVPMDTTIKRILYGVIIVAVLLLLLSALGIGFSTIHFGK